MRQLTSLPDERPKYLGDSEETLQCESCNNTWTRISRRGRKPKLCPSCVEAKTQVRAISAPVDPAVLEARLVLAREKKAERAQERAKLASEQQEKDRQKVRDMLPNLSLLWNRAWEIANRENTDAAWNKCEQLMVNYVNMRKSLD